VGSVGCALDVVCMLVNANRDETRECDVPGEWKGSTYLVVCAYSPSILGPSRHRPIDQFLWRTRGSSDLPWPDRPYMA
jgi:hypothetical protein